MSWIKRIVSFSANDVGIKKFLKYFLVFLPYILLLSFLVIAPIVLILTFSLTNDGAISFVNFSNIFIDDHIQLIFKTIGISLLATTICLIVGYPTAYAISKLSNAGRILVIGLLTIPIWINMILRIRSFNAVFTDNGFLDTLFKALGSAENDFRSSWVIILFSMVFIFLPFMTLPIYNSLTRLDRSLIDASNDLGASKKTTFFRVLLPISYSGIHIGILLVFLPSSTTVAMAGILTDDKVRLIGGRITRLYSSDREFVAALSIITLIFLIVMASISGYITRKYSVKQVKNPWVRNSIRRAHAYAKDKIKKA